MIQTKDGTKIEFIKRDRWVVEMQISTSNSKGFRVVASPVFTIDQLQEELSILQQQRGPKAGKKRI